MELVHLEKDVQNVRDCFRRRKTRSDAWRSAQLERLMISKGRTVGVAKKSLNLALSCLEDGMTSKKVASKLSS
ncbi:hypothetical protein AAC387_Pa06g3187 [Persea americana]